MPEKYRIELSHFNNDQEAVITVYDRISHTDGHELCRQAKQMMEQGLRKWVIDLVKLPFCDSTTLGICIMLHTTVRRFAGTIQFRVNTQSQVYQFLQSSQLDRILTIVEPCLN